MVLLFQPKIHLNLNVWPLNCRLPLDWIWTTWKESNVFSYQQLRINNSYLNFKSNPRRRDFMFSDWVAAQPEHLQLAEMAILGTLSRAYVDKDSDVVSAIWKFSFSLLSDIFKVSVDRFILSERWLKCKTRLRNGFTRYYNNSFAIFISDNNLFCIILLFRAVYAWNCDIVNGIKLRTI